MKKAFKTLFVWSLLIGVGTVPLWLAGLFPVTCAMLLLALIGGTGWAISAASESPYDQARRDAQAAMPHDPNLKITVGGNNDQPKH